MAGHRRLWLGMPPLWMRLKVQWQRCNHLAATGVSVQKLKTQKECVQAGASSCAGAV